MVGSQPPLLQPLPKMLPELNAGASRKRSRCALQGSPVQLQQQLKMPWVQRHGAHRERAACADMQRLRQPMPGPGCRAALMLQATGLRRWLLRASPTPLCSSGSSWKRPGRRAGGSEAS